jgi:hypothetical protein
MAPVFRDQPTTKGAKVLNPTSHHNSASKSTSLKITCKVDAAPRKTLAASE